MNLARIKLMALLLHALCRVQTISLHKQVDAMPTTIEKNSYLKRLRRFFAIYVLDLDMERITRLVAMVCLALVWASLIGEHKDISINHPSSIKPKNPQPLRREQGIEILKGMSQAQIMAVISAINK